MANKNKIQSEFIEMLMENCPFEIPVGEEELANEILREAVFGSERIDK